MTSGAIPRRALLLTWMQKQSIPVSIGAMIGGAATAVVLGFDGDDHALGVGAAVAAVILAATVGFAKRASP